MKTLFELAEDFIRHYVKRGESVARIKRGQGGGYSNGVSVKIGVIINGKNVLDKIQVERNGEVAIYSLRKVYNSVKFKLRQSSLF